MGKYVINGGNRISGSIKISSAKNSVLPIIAGSILTEDEVVIKDCPKIIDVINMVKILRSIGVRAEFFQDDLIIASSGLNSHVVKSEYSRELRASILMMGALISRVKKAKISYPGGCEIGLRPIDIHLSALSSLGVKIKEQGEGINCYGGRLNGGHIYLDFPSVGATENAMLSSVFIKGKTEIHNPAKEPEIVDLMKFLNSMGAKVYGAGTSTILIEGVEKLHGTTFRPIGDRIEAGTFLIAGAITNGEIEIIGCNAKNISYLLHKLCDNACKITVKNDIIYLKYGGSRKSFSFTTGPHPCFPTDLQPQAMALASISDGVSIITENVFETRFKHVTELTKMGADIKVKGRTAIIEGVKNLVGAEVNAHDLRCGASLILAGLSADGTTVVCDSHHIERGYFELEKKLASLGADIRKKG